MFDRPVVRESPTMRSKHIVEAAAEAGAVRHHHASGPPAFEVRLCSAPGSTNIIRPRRKVMNIIRSIRTAATTIRISSPECAAGPLADLMKTRFDICGQEAWMNREKFRLRTDLFERRQGPQLRLL